MAFCCMGDGCGMWPVRAECQEFMALRWLRAAGCGCWL